MSAIPNIFDHCPIDRAAIKRPDPGWWAGHADKPAIYVWQGLVAVTGSETPRLALIAPDIVSGTRLFLGLQQGQPVVAILGDSAEPPAIQDAQLVNLREVGLLLPPDEASLAAYALAYAYWHARHKFCGVCGAALETLDAGHRKLCSACDAEHFPRTDPAIIVLVTHGDHALLARNHKYPPGRWSTLAGFVEPGESLEAAVRREMLEEVGVTLTHIAYQSSQPWPFPGSLMLGFYAEAKSMDITPDGVEIVDAQWMTREDIRRALQRPATEFSLPNPISISRRLIDEWLAQDTY
jgi:NAD+ diphosphatase